MAPTIVPARLSRHTVGLLFIFATALIWILTSFISESLVSPGSSGTAAVHPFLLTYLATSLFTLYLPLLHIKSWLSELKDARQRRMGDRVAVATQEASPSKTTVTGSAPPRVTSSAPMIAAAWATPLWFAAQFTFNVSLSLTSVTSNTILSSTSSLFTFFLSILLLSEKFTSKKLLAIAACIIGTALVTISDSSSGSGRNGSVWGDAMAVLSAALYGAYTVVMRKKMPGEEAEAHVAHFFGYLGLFNTVVLAPIVVLLLSMNVFSLSTIPKDAYLIIVLEGLLDYVLSDYLWARAVMLLGPTVATLGLSIQIPMAASAELAMGRATWVHSTNTILMTVAGTALILCGFFSINLSSSASPGEKSSAAGASIQHSNHKDKTKSSDDEEDLEETAGLLAATRGTRHVHSADGEAAAGQAAPSSAVLEHS